MTAPSVTDLLDLLREAFDRSGLTQTQLAERLGIHPGEVSRRLHNPADLRWSTLTRTLAAMGARLDLAAALSVSPEDPEPELPPGVSPSNPDAINPPSDWLLAPFVFVPHGWEALTPVDRGDRTGPLTWQHHDAFDEPRYCRPAPVPAAPAEPGETPRRVLTAVEDAKRSLSLGQSIRDGDAIILLAEVDRSLAAARPTHPQRIDDASVRRHTSPTVVDDGEIRVEPLADGFMLYVQVDPNGDEVSHLLTAADAAALSDALAPNRIDEDDPLVLRFLDAIEAVGWWHALPATDEGKRAEARQILGMLTGPLTSEPTAGAEAQWPEGWSGVVTRRVPAETMVVRDWEGSMCHDTEAEAIAEAQAVIDAKR